MSARVYNQRRMAAMVTIARRLATRF